MNDPCNLAYITCDHSNSLVTTVTTVTTVTNMAATDHPPFGTCTNRRPPAYSWHELYYPFGRSGCDPFEPEKITDEQRGCGAFSGLHLTGKPTDDQVRQLVKTDYGEQMCQLCISYTGISVDHLIALLDGMPHMKTLMLCGPSHSEGDDDADETYTAVWWHDFMTKFRDNTNVTGFYAIQHVLQNLTPLDIRFMMMNLPPQITRLSFRENELADVRFHEIASVMIEQNRGFNELDLGRNKLTDAVVPKLLELLFKHHLSEQRVEELDLFANEFTNAGVQALYDSLSKNKLGLQTLFLFLNSVDNQDLINDFSELFPDVFTGPEPQDLSDYLD